MITAQLCKSDAVGSCNFCDRYARNVFVLRSEVPTAQIEVRVCPECMELLHDKTRYQLHHR